MRNISVVLLLTMSSISIGQSLDPLTFFTANELERANTAKEVDYLTKEEKDIFLFNNLARMWPGKFYKFYVSYCVSGGRERYLKTNYYYTTLSEELQTRQPVGPLLPDRRMFELAECWAVESGEKGIVGHDRVTCPTGYGGENCAYGYGGGLDIVMQLLIDSGVESLGHRKNMLRPGWKGLGTAIRPHDGYRHCAVQNFASTNDVLRAEAEIRRLKREAEEAERARLLDLRAERFVELMGKWTEAEMDQADVCRSLDYLSEFEKEFYLYYNLARLYPTKFKKLIWDEGPYFDQFIEPQQETIHKEMAYKRIESMLRLSNPKSAFIPTKEYMDAGRCVQRKWRSDGNSTSCLPGPGSWRLQTYYPETTHNDIINIFLNDKDYEDLFEKNANLIIINEDDQAVKVFLR